MKIYNVNGRDVWLNEPPKGYVEPEQKKTEEKVEPKTEPKPKAKAKRVSNKSRKEVGNK